MIPTRASARLRWSAGDVVRRAVKAAAMPWGAVTRRRRGDVVILLYHRVGAANAEIHVPPDVFGRQMEMLAATGQVRTMPEALSGAGGIVVTFDDGYADFHAHALPVLVRNRIPALLYLATGLVDGGRGALTWTQVREAAESGAVTVGSHTDTHRDLSSATEGEAEAEMRRSRELIEDRLGRPCRHFAYPWAVGSPAADRVARRMFDSAALHAWRTNRRGRIDPHRLGRTPVLRNDGVAFFGAKVRGMLNGEALAYRLARRGPWRGR